MLKHDISLWIYVGKAMEKACTKSEELASLSAADVATIYALCIKTRVYAQKVYSLIRLVCTQYFVHSTDIASSLCTVSTGPIISRNFIKQIHF